VGQRGRRATLENASAVIGAHLEGKTHPAAAGRQDFDWSADKSVRLIASGRVKATYLSERRIGIRSDHDREYLDACAQESA
jgi:hypothetical protein